MVIQKSGYTVDQVVNKGGVYVSRFMIAKLNNNLVSKKGMDTVRTNFSWLGGTNLELKRGGVRATLYVY